MGASAVIGAQWLCGKLRSYVEMILAVDGRLLHFQNKLSVEGFFILLRVMWKTNACWLEMELTEAVNIRRR